VLGYPADSDQGWKVSIAVIMALGTNLDIKNPGAFDERPGDASMPIVISPTALGGSSCCLSGM
jgi:hypothetical protein